MGAPFQRKGGVSPDYFRHPSEDRTPEEASAASAEYIAYENARRARINAEQAEADQIARTVRWFSMGETFDRLRTRDESSFQESYGMEPKWP